MGRVAERCLKWLASLKLIPDGAFLAGLPPVSDPLLCDLAGEGAWQRHAGVLGSSWADLEEGRLSKVREWSATHIAAASAAQGTMFYMFSGPDFLYANTIFPNAGTYILCGIEPVGPPPEVYELSRAGLGRELRALRDSLDSVLSFSFFITREMKVDLQDHALSGTLPILYIFLARTGKTICDVSYVSLDADGTVTQVADPRNATRSAKSPAPGSPDQLCGERFDTRQTLYYFSTDISDTGLRQSGFLEFCRSHAPGNSCVKSASYLMHESCFSTIRSFLLENSQTLVQDDSGIPCSFFTPEAWRLRFFGSYPGPIPLFKEYTQPMLAQYYRTSNPLPLDFGIGYRHRAGESTLMVAEAPARHPGRGRPQGGAAGGRARSQVPEPVPRCRSRRPRRRAPGNARSGTAPARTCRGGPRGGEHPARRQAPVAGRSPAAAARRPGPCRTPHHVTGAEERAGGRNPSALLSEPPGPGPGSGAGTPRRRKVRFLALAHDHQVE